MQLDAETIRWVLSGFFILAATVISWLFNRQFAHLEDTITGHGTEIDSAHDRINSMKLDIAEKYVSKTELERQLDTHLSPIRDDMRDIKDDIKALLQRQ